MKESTFKHIRWQNTLVSANLTLIVDTLRQPHEILYKEITFKHIFGLFEDEPKANTCIVY